MYKNKKILILIILSFGYGVSSCSFSGKNSNQELAIPGLESTLAVQTIAARPELQHLLITATPTRLPIEPEKEIEQNMLQPSTLQLDQAGNTPVPSLTPIASKETCTNSAKFIKDVTIPDYTLMKPGEKFVKTWRFENTGTCPWTENYAIVFMSGEQMAGLSPSPIHQIVLPGEQIDISLNLIAPNTTTFSKGNWIFLDANGNTFGTGYYSGNFFWVAIDVGSKSKNNKLDEISFGVCGPSG